MATTDTFLSHPAGGKAASQVGPKIVLDHVRVYLYMYIYIYYVCVLWVSSPLRCYSQHTFVEGSQGLRNSNRASRHSCMPGNQVRLKPNLLTTPFSV